MPPRASPTPARILVVDDEPLIRETLAEFLTSEGFFVAACASAEEALEAAAERAYDIALCDIQLPDVNGRELLPRLRAKHPVKAIALSGYGTELDIRASLDAGFLTHLVKPVEIETLVAAIELALATDRPRDLRGAESQSHARVR